MKNEEGRVLCGCCEKTLTEDEIRMNENIKDENEWQCDRCAIAEARGIFW